MYENVYHYKNIKSGGKNDNVIVCGGAGYIGSHICVELLDAGYEVTVIDDFSNSKPEVLEHIKEITGKEVKFYEFNILDEEKTELYL